MNCSLARSLTLAVSALLAVLALAPTANAATLPGNFFVDQIHGQYAWGRIGEGLGSSAYSTRRVRVDLRSGARHEFSAPDGGQYFQVNVSSDEAIAGIKYSGNYDGGDQLVRYEIDGGYQVLDSLTSGQKNCPSDINPVSIENDGTVVAVKRVFVDVSKPGRYECALDDAHSHVIRYLPGTGGSQKLWLPDKYRPWLREWDFAASGDTFAIARSATKDRAGAVVVLDTKRRKVIAKRRAGRLAGISLANPHSLFYAQDAARKNGKLLHWRIGRPAPRVIFRGSFSSGGNCGNRAKLITANKLTLLTTNGRKVLTRRISKDNYFSSITCSNSYLHFLDVVDDGDYSGNSAFTRQLINTSKLPR